jgi:hypothetical protein
MFTPETTSSTIEYWVVPESHLIVSLEGHLTYPDTRQARCLRSQEHSRSNYLPDIFTTRPKEI